MDGTIELDISKGNDKVGIKITKIFPDVVIGNKIDREGADFRTTETHTLYVTFDVSDIINKIMEGGVDAWDKEKDGKITTLCPTLDPTEG